jgi:RimJ/RimL family protein N-acetyltransferase
MWVFNISTNETDILKKIIQIHDEIPLAYDPIHFVSQEYLEKLLRRVQSNDKQHGFWILSKLEKYSPDTIAGILWATIEKKVDILVCSINSLWINPELRNQNLCPLLTEQCLRWAKEQNAKSLECATHYDNIRLREILEKHNFKKGMLQYSLELICVH